MQVDDGEKIFLETVRIIKGATTSFSATYENATINNIVSHIVSTPEIALTLELESVAQNATLSGNAVVTGIENASASYSWYIDGVLLTGETNTTLSYSPLSNLVVGTHRLTFVVSNGEVIWSKDVNFEVKEAFYIEDFTINSALEYVYTDKLDVSLSKNFDDTYSITWFIDGNEIIPSDVVLSDYIGQHSLIVIIEKYGVSKSAQANIFIKAIASNLKIDSAYEGLVIKGSVSIQPENANIGYVTIMLESVDDNSTYYCHVNVDEKSNFSGSMPDTIKMGKYKAYIKDSSVKCDDVIEVEVLAKPSFTISGPEKIKQYAEAVFELSPDLSLSGISWQIDGNYVNVNCGDKENQLALKYDKNNTTTFYTVGEHTLKAYYGGNELASFVFTVEALNGIDSIIMEALPSDYWQGQETLLSENAYSKMKFNNAQGTTLEDGIAFVANTYGDDYITYDVKYPTGTGYSTEVKGNADITYSEGKFHYSIGSLKFDYMPSSEGGSSITIKNIKAESVFKGDVDITNDDSEIERVVSFVMGLLGVGEGVTHLEEKNTSTEKFTFTDFKNNEYTVNGSVLSKQDNVNNTFSSSFTFEKESEKNTFSYDISYKKQSTENGIRYFDTVISNIKFEGENIELSNLTDATITRMKDFVGDQEK